MRLFPRPLAARPDRKAVAPGIVHKWYPEDVKSRGLPALRLAQEAPPAPAQTVREPHQRPQERQLYLGQVLPGGEVRGVGAGGRVDDRVLADLLDLRVVPAAAEVVAGEVVGGVGDPLGGLSVLRAGEVDAHHLPVGFVVVHSEKPRAPVVKRVEKPVLERGPAVPPENPAVIAVPDLSRVHLLHDLGGGGRGVPRDPAAGQERQ